MRSHRLQKAMQKSTCKADEIFGLSGGGDGAGEGYGRGALREQSINVITVKLQLKDNDSNRVKQHWSDTFSAPHVSPK